MRYIISGIHRSGTSVLVKSIFESSELTPYFSLEIEEIIRSREIDPEYDPNPSGYFSHGKMFAPISDWVSETPDNSVFKAAPEAFLNSIVQEKIFVAMIERSQAEIEESYKRAFGHSTLDVRYGCQIRAKELLEVDPNVNFTKINFSDLMSDPVDVFGTLANNGWPIDPIIAAENIDASLYRNIS